MSDRKPSALTLSLLEIDAAHNDFMSWAGIRAGAQFYVVCTEGVAYNITDYSDEKLDQYFGQTFAELASAIDDQTYGTVKPEDFIRTFGSRLESNYHAFCYTVHESMSGANDVRSAN